MNEDKRVFCINCRHLERSNGLFDWEHRECFGYPQAVTVNCIYGNRYRYRRAAEINENCDCPKFEPEPEPGKPEPQPKDFSRRMLDWFVDDRTPKFLAIVFAIVVIWAAVVMILAVIARAS